MIKLFTHTDLDGIGCAILAYLAFGRSNVDITYCNYDDVDNQVKDFISTKLLEEDMCHITDISIKDEIAKDIDENCTQFYLFDHHPTALDLNKYIWCTVKIVNENTDIKTSGTEIYYKWLVENGYLAEDKFIQKFAELVRDYDTWRWSTLGDKGVICKQVNDLYYLYGKDKFITWVISEISDNVFPRFYAADELLLDMKQKEIDEYIEIKNQQMITSPMCGHVCGFVFAEKYHSELGNRLCKMHPEIDFITMIDMDGTVSYRTVKDDIDLGKDVAKLFGGGGHPKAAGSQFDKSIMLNTIVSIFR